jgi:hypothetical protein
MSGYGFYEEEEGQGIITGAGARARRKYVAEMAVSTRTGKRYPRRLGYTLEYAAKHLYNKQLAARNPWLKYVNQDETLKELRKQVGDRMKEIAKAYRATLTPEQQELAQERAQQRKASEKRKKEMIDSMIANFKARYPNVKSALNYILNNKTMPNKTAARIFLRALYGISKDEAEKLLPTGKRVRARKYRTAIEKEFLGPGAAPAITVSTAPEEEEKKEEVLEESKPAQPPPQPQPAPPKAPPKAPPPKKKTK